MITGTTLVEFRATALLVKHIVVPQWDLHAKKNAPYGPIAKDGAFKVRSKNRLGCCVDRKTLQLQ